MKHEELHQKARRHEIRQPSGAGVACHQPPIAAPIDRVPEDIFACQQVDQK
ncbi:MAG: hypothetical protein QOH05_2649 [Acetobacteraceae bacterium]|jgi:hypothetical protein|nr:hypothetical protein [Acetobacteraceae bacterium]